MQVWERPIQGRILDMNVQRFREGLAFKAHRRLHHSTLIWSVMKKEDKDDEEVTRVLVALPVLQLLAAEAVISSVRLCMISTQAQ